MSSVLRNAVGAFTLIELLVALSILALLSAMAVPALRGAMERADQTVCIANLRQMGQAMSEYVVDYGHYPAAELEVQDAAWQVVERKRWYHLISPYLDGSPRSWSSGQSRATIDPVSGLATLTIPPSEDDKDPAAFPEVFSCPKAAGWRIGRNGAYGYNHQTLGDARALPGSASGHRLFPVRPNDLADRQRTVVLMDSAGTGVEPYADAQQPDSAALGNHSFTVDPPRLPERGGTRLGSDGELAGLGTPLLPSRPHARHRGGVCVLFAGLNVEWLPLEKLTLDDSLWNGRGVASEAP
ncbi:MAG: DUF1559 domain-containing protein [Planctomycetota bacterium]